jgi:uncharacterized protein YjbK
MDNSGSSKPSHDSDKSVPQSPVAFGIECEVKLEVASKSDLLGYLAVLPRPRRWGMQLNCYLDTPGAELRSAGISLRVRITPDHARLTLKQKRGRQGATFRTEETEVQVPRPSAIAWVVDGKAFDLAKMPGFEGVAGRVAGMTLGVVNWSLTRRAICDTEEGVTIEVDETVFPDGHRDFEIEAEDLDPDKAMRVMTAFAVMANITLKPQTRTKHARADAHKGETPFVIPEGDPSGAMPCGLEDDR